MWVEGGRLWVLRFEVVGLEVRGGGLKVVRFKGLRLEVVGLEVGGGGA